MGPTLSSLCSDSVPQTSVEKDDQPGALVMKQLQRRQLRDDLTGCQWLNDFIMDIFPRIDQYLQDMIHNTVQPEIRAALPAGFKSSVQFGEVTIGKASPQFGPIVLRERDEDSIVLDIQIDLETELVLSMSFVGIKVGIRDILFRGTLSVAFTSPCTEPPFFGGVEVYFVNNPEIDFDFTGVTNFADAPGVRDIIRNVIWTQVNKHLVIPARIAIDFLDTDSQDVADFQFPPPIGVVRFTLYCASNLKAMDTGFMSSGKSDPYVVVSLGGGKWKSERKLKTLDPVWKENNQFDFCVHDDRQIMHLDLWDEDYTSFHDELGSGTISFEHIDKGGGITDQEVPLTLQGKNAGSVEVGIEWLNLCDKKPANPCRECGAADSAPAKMYLSAKVGKVLGMETMANKFKAPFKATLKSSDGEVSLVTLPSSGAPLKNASMVFPPQKAICEKLHERKMAIHDIADVTELDEATVQHICDKADGKHHADTDFEKLRQNRAAMHPQFFQVLEEWITKKEAGHLYFELHDHSNTLVGKTRAIEYKEILAAVGMEVNGPFKVSPEITLQGRVRMRWLTPEA